MKETELHRNYDLYVSTNGDDRGDGSKSFPVQTLYRAAKLAKDKTCRGTAQINGQPVTATVHVAGGKYFLPTPLSLTEADSHVRWVAEGEVILTGSMTLNGLTWESYDRNPSIRVSDIMKGMNIDQLFINGTQQILARYPNYTPHQPLQGCTTQNDIKARSAYWNDPEGGYIRALHHCKWGGNSYRITGKNDSDLGLSCEWVGDNNRGAGMHPDAVMVENIFEELDAPCEWYYDAVKGKLYVYPDEGVVLGEDTQVEGAVSCELIRITGVQDGASATDILFDGFTLENTARTLYGRQYVPLMRGDWCVVRSGALFLQNAENVFFRNGCIRNVGGNAIFLSGHCKDIVVENNEICHVGSSGIMVAGLPDSCREASFWEFSSLLSPETSEAYVHKTTIEDTLPGPAAEHYPRECRIESNHIQHIGIWEKQSSQVAISVASRIRVLRNTIHEGPRAGININDGTFGGHEIAYNDVFDVQRETDDHGMFNSWGRDRFWSLGGFDTMGSRGRDKEPYSLLDCVEPIRIHDNRFHFGGRVDGGSTFGIDLDDGSSNYKIYNNLCLNMGIKLREGFYREVYNNILVNGSFHLHCTFENSHDRIYGNIVICGHPYQLAGTNDRRFALSRNEIDQNCFYDFGSAISFPSFWADLGDDTHSITGNEDPDFQDPASNQYTVQNRKLARLIGFTDFPMDAFGKPHCKAVCPAFQKTAPDIFADILQREEWQGAIISALDESIMSSAGAGSLKGVYVDTVPEQSPVFNYGLQSGDVILSVNGVSIEKKSDFLPILNALPQGVAISLRIVRNQQIRDISFFYTGAGEGCESDSHENQP